MILLAAYSEKNWFVIGHARQLGQDLGLQELASQLKDSQFSQTKFAGQVLEGKELARALRTWMVLQHVEQEVAAGTARQSQIPMIAVDPLRSFLRHPQSTVFDARIISTIEIVHLRG